MTMMIVVIFIIVIDKVLLSVESNRPIPIEAEIGSGLVAKNWVMGYTSNI